MRNSVVIVVFIILGFGCGRAKIQPNNIFESVPDKITLKHSIYQDHENKKPKGFVNEDSLKSAAFKSMCDSILFYINSYKSNTNQSDFKQAAHLWDNTKNYFNANKKWIKTAVDSWYEVNTNLLKMTGETVYADQLDRFSALVSDQELLKGVVFTMDADNVYVNLFEPSTLNFKHSLGGLVEIEQRTNEHNVQLLFKMEIKQYVEVYLRIPNWAKGAEVEVKKVKYLAIPGSYCKIAKKWKEGDKIDIRLPLQNS